MERGPDNSIILFEKPLHYHVNQIRKADSKLGRHQLPRYGIARALTHTVQISQQGDSIRSQHPTASFWLTAIPDYPYNGEDDDEPKYPVKSPCELCRRRWEALGR